MPDFLCPLGPFLRCLSLRAKGWPCRATIFFNEYTDETVLRFSEAGRPVPRFVAGFLATDQKDLGRFE